MKIIPLIVFLAIGGTSAARMRRVAEGEPIPTKDASFLVAITRGGWRSCIGSLISRDRVLTAGRCVVDEDTHQYPGLRVVMAKGLQDIPGAGHRVSDVRLSRAVTGSLTRDLTIAILILSKSIPWYVNVAPIKLPTEDVLDAQRSSSSASLRAQVISISNVLNPFPEKPIHQLEVLVERCELPKVFCGEAWFGKITAVDEGAPLVHNKRLIGIALNHRSKEGSDLYVDVHKYLEFIRE